MVTVLGGGTGCPVAAFGMLATVKILWAVIIEVAVDAAEVVVIEVTAGLLGSGN